MQHSRLVAGIAAAALPLALLAGCSEAEPTPKFEDPTSEPRASESATPDEPVKPTPPAAMKGDDVEAAKAFVKYYFELLGYAQATGDTRPVEKIALPDCAACRGTVDLIDRIYETGGTVEGGDFSVHGLQADAQGTFGVDGKSFAATAHVSTSKQTISGSTKGALNGTTKRGGQDLQLLVTKGAGVWQMARWGAA